MLLSKKVFLYWSNKALNIFFIIITIIYIWVLKFCLSSFNVYCLAYLDLHETSETNTKRTLERKESNYKTIQYLLTRCGCVLCKKIRLTVQWCCCKVWAGFGRGLKTLFKFQTSNNNIILLKPISLHLMMLKHLLII